MFLQIYDQDTYVAIADNKVATTRGRRAQFQVVRPGLTVRTNTVSLMSYEKPGWYLRHYEGRLYLEPKVNPRNPEDFDSDATFIEHSDAFFQQYVAFESINNPGYYVSRNESQELHLHRREDTDVFNRSSSFALLSADSKRTKRSVFLG